MPVGQNPGLTPEIQQALARRQQGVPVPQMQQSNQQAMPQPQNPSELNRAIAPQAAPQPKFEPQDRKDLIVQALISQLDLDNKADKQARELSQPAPQPMGGGAMGGCGYKQPQGGSMAKMDQQSNYW